MESSTRKRLNEKFKIVNASRNAGFFIAPILIAVGDTIGYTKIWNRMEIMENLIEFGKRICDKYQYFQCFLLFVGLDHTHEVGGSSPSTPT
jgi:hypothetical protein